MTRPTNKSMLAAIAALALLVAIGLKTHHEHKHSEMKSTHTSESSTTPVSQTPQQPRSWATTSQSTHPPVASATKSMDAIGNQDRYFRTAKAREEARQEEHERPAYQHLPYRTDEVRIDIANVTSDGRVVLKVIPRGLNVNPRIAYKRFLERYRDSGSAYLAEYARYQP